MKRKGTKKGQSVYKNGLSGMKVFGEFLMTEKLGTYEPDKIYVSEISPHHTVTVSKIHAHLKQ